MNVEDFRRYRRNLKSTSNQNRLELSSFKLFLVFFLNMIVKRRNRSSNSVELFMKSREEKQSPIVVKESFNARRRLRFFGERL